MALTIESTLALLQTNPLVFTIGPISGGNGTVTARLYRAPDINGSPGTFISVLGPDVVNDGNFYQPYDTATGNYWYMVVATDDSVAVSSNQLYVLQLPQFTRPTTAGVRKMSKIDTTQLSSIPLNFNPMFPVGFQTLGETTTLHAYNTTLTIPVAVAGDGSTNPVAVFDNRSLRATYIVLAFGMTAANNVKLAFDVTGFTQIGGDGLYIPTRFFLGEAQAGNKNISTPINEATAFLADNFSLKTFASSFVSYIEPADDFSAALMFVDMNGSDVVGVRLATGAATAATKGQVWVGVL